jgi:energy-coupling factor transporter ATP-binding protein EcfA2
MTAAVRNRRDDDAHLRAVSAFQRIVGRLNAIERHLRLVEAWLPGRELLAEVAWSRKKIGELQEAWGKKLIVALVGPSGAGKSTLLNALAGRELSVAGRQRPTTREVIIYAQSLSDSEELARHCGAHNVRVVVDHQAAGLNYLTLVDAPDTNTLPENQALLNRVLEKTDLLLAVFPAPNPKMHDNVAFLRPYVRRFPRGAVVPVLNKVDRVPRAELEDQIVPDFRGVMAREWGLGSDTLFLTSARSSAPGAWYPEDEQPLHDVDETDGLRQFLSKYVESMGRLIDRRLAGAERLVDLICDHCLEALKRTARERAQAGAQLSHFTEQTTRALILEFQKIGEGEVRSAPSAALYAAVGPLWWGPVGWLVGIWSALLGLASAVGRVFRRGGSGRRVLFAGEGSGQEISSARDTTGKGRDEGGALLFALRGLYASQWPAVADSLVSSGFDVAVRESAHWAEWAAQSQGTIVSRWREVFLERVDFLARRLSIWPLQVLLNAPVLTLLGWICAETLGSFFAREYLPADYFRQALIVLALVWVLSFVALQMLVSAFTGRRFYRILTRQLIEGELGLTTAWAEQLRVLQGLEVLCR